MQRYYLRTDPSYSPTMLPSPDGSWVGFADAESELSTLRARVAELTASLSTVCGIRDHLQARLAALEAPPVVPYAWHVENEGGEWVLRRDNIRIVDNYGGTENARCMAHNLACLVYAIRNNARPRHWADEITPHESDGEVTP